MSIIHPLANTHLIYAAYVQHYVYVATVYRYNLIHAKLSIIIKVDGTHKEYITVTPCHYHYLEKVILKGEHELNGTFTKGQRKT